MNARFAPSRRLVATCALALLGSSPALARQMASWEGLGGWTAVPEIVGQTSTGTVASGGNPLYIPPLPLYSGTGFAPIKALIQQLQLKGSTRPAVLYWGARRRADLYQHAWCEQAAAETPWLRYVPVLSEPTADCAWDGRTGFVHQAVMADHPDLSGHQVYACGAPVMVESAQRDFVARCGLPDDEFYADSFTSEADKHGAAA